MIERDLELTLHDLAEIHVRHEVPADLREATRLVPLTTTGRRSWMPQVPVSKLRPLFSVTRTVVAMVVVALFGGFLLAGLLTQPSEEQAPAAVSPSPTLPSHLLPGVDLVTEELAPGVFRIVDGRSPMLGALLGDRTMSQSLSPDISLTFGHDGHVWVFYRHGFFRLGDGRVHLWPDYTNDSVACPEGRSCHEVAPDGTVWTSGQDEDGRAVLRSYDGVAWTEHVLPYADPNAGAASIEVEVLADGSVWALAQAQGWGRLARLDANGWVDLGPLPAPAVPGSFHVTDAGDAWIGPSDGPDTLYVRRTEAGTWRRIGPS